MTSHDSLEALRRLIAMRIQEWRLGESERQARPGPVVAITREPGSGAESIAETLSAELNLHSYSWEIVEQIAQDAHVSTEVVSSLDEKASSELEEWLADFKGDRSFSSHAYMETLKKVIFAIAAHGNAVIVGRGSNFFLPAGKRIGLALVAPLDVKIKNIMKELGISEKQARGHIANVETEQQTLVRKYFKADIHDPTQYHLIINTALIKPETIVQIVKGIIEAGA